MAIKLKKLTTAEQAAIEKRARSRTAPAREVERARLILLADMGQRVPAIAQELALTETTVRTWLKRFNEAGLDGLQDRPRAGRPVTYQPEQVAEVIATALTDPRQLNQPFACWTLDRLATSLNEEKQIAIKRSRIDALLMAEGLRWRTQETWFGERVDPAFAKKRGALQRSTPPPCAECGHLPGSDGASRCQEVSGTATGRRRTRRCTANSGTPGHAGDC
jgi:transposase